MSQSEDRDPLADVFRDVALPPENPQQRETIFAQTRGVLRRRRVMRHSLRLAALAACYVVGVLSVLGWQSLQPRSELVVQPGNIAGNSNTESNPPSAPNVDETKNVIAESTPAESLSTFEKLRRAGDRQLNERGNLKGALGCYRRALDFARDDELQIVPDRDSWLLMSLKESQLEERKHGHKKS